MIFSSEEYYESNLNIKRKPSIPPSSEIEGMPLEFSDYVKCWECF